MFNDCHQNYDFASYLLVTLDLRLTFYQRTHFLKSVLHPSIPHTPLQKYFISVFTTHWRSTIFLPFQSPTHQIFLSSVLVTQSQSKTPIARSMQCKFNSFTVYQDTTEYFISFRMLIINSLYIYTKKLPSVVLKTGRTHLFYNCPSYRSSRV